MISRSAVDGKGKFTTNDGRYTWAYAAKDSIKELPKLPTTQVSVGTPAAAPPPVVSAGTITSSAAPTDMLILAEMIAKAGQLSGAYKDMVSACLVSALQQVR